MSVRYPATWQSAEGPADGVWYRHFQAPATGGKSAITATLLSGPTGGTLDQYAQSCYDGDMDACDTLYNESEVGSDYETYGGTCAGRQPATNSDVVYCTDAFPS